MCVPTRLVVLASVVPGCVVCSYSVGCTHISSPWIPCVFLQGWLSSHQLSLDTMCVPTGLVVLASAVPGYHVCSYRVGCPRISCPWIPCVFLQGWLSSHQLSLDALCVPTGLVVLTSVVPGYHVCSYRVGCPRISCPWIPCVFLQGWLSWHQLSLDNQCAHLC